MASTIRFVDLYRDQNNDLRYLVIDEERIASADPTVLSWSALPIVLQTQHPTTAGATGYCLLYNLTSADFTGASTSFTVEIVDSTNFRWRKDAGSWSSSIPIATTVDIGVALKVAFLATSGFTASDTWVWTAGALPYTGITEPTTANSSIRLSGYGLDVYIAPVSRNILRLRNGFVSSVGYKRVFGKYATFFAEHLVIAQFTESVYDSGVEDPYDEAVTPFTLGWSHLNNPDEFYASDINEAGTYLVPSVDFPDTRDNGITGLGEIGDLCYVYLPDSIYRMRYVGLPSVFQVEKAFAKIGNRHHNALVVTPRGHYFIGQTDFYRFDGTVPQSIGEPIREKFFEEFETGTVAYQELLFGYYDVGKDEVVWTYYISIGVEYQCRQVVYQERDNQWYFRNVPAIRCQGRLYGDYKRCVYGAYNSILKDMDPDAGDNMADTLPDKTVEGGNDTYTEPYVISHATKYGTPRMVKETDGQYIDAALGTATNIEYSIARSNFVANLPSSETAVTQVWTPSKVDGILGFQKISAKTVRHKLVFKGSKVYGAKLYEWGDVGYAGGAEK